MEKFCLAVIQATAVTSCFVHSFYYYNDAVCMYDFSKYIIEIEAACHVEYKLISLGKQNRKNSKTWLGLDTKRGS